MTCSLKLVTVSSHLRNGNLVALLNTFFQLQLNFCCIKTLTQLQQCVTLIWHFCIHKALLKYLNLESTTQSWEVGKCHYNFTEKETVPKRLKWLSLLMQQVYSGAGITAPEAPGSRYTTMLWRKVIAQNSTEGSCLLLIIGQQRALDELIGQCIMSLIIHN